MNTKTNALSRRHVLLGASAAGALCTLSLARSKAIQDESSGLIFLARVPYGTPSGRHIYRIQEDTWLSYFQKIWSKGLSSKEALGISSYGIDPLFDAMKSQQPPKTNEELHRFIENNSYNHGVNVAKGLFEYVSDDDELDMSYHFIDEGYSKKHNARLAFLLRDSWLPRDAKRDDKSKPKTWVVSRMPSQSADSNLWDIFEIDGVRLDQIGEVYAVMDKADATFDSGELKAFLKKQVKKEGWNTIVAAFVAQGAKLEKNMSQFQCSQHLCEVYDHCGTWGKQNVFQQLIVFDDLWASTHPELFRSFKTLRKSKLLDAPLPVQK